MVSFAASMFMLANNTTEAPDKTIEDAHDPVVKIDEDEDAAIRELKKLIMNSLLNSEIEYKIPPEYLDGEFMLK